MSSATIKAKSQALRSARESGVQKIESLTKLRIREQSSHSIEISRRNGKLTVTESARDGTRGRGDKK